MAVDALIIPPLLCALGVMAWITTSDSTSPDQIFRRSRSFAKSVPDKNRVRARLACIGRADGYAAFRIRQFLLVSLGVGTSFVIGFLLTNSLIPAVLSSGISGVAVHVVVDRRLSKEVMKYRLDIESEFASIIEMLTLSLSAGETPLSAMARISSQAHGALASEFGQVIVSVRQGHSFQDSLDAFGRHVDSVVVRRFVDSLINAMLRGAPLIEVLQRHAAEARANQRNIMMDKAGKAEISMMVPVVFLILPISVLFALWPSLTHLNMFAG